MADERDGLALEAVPADPVVEAVPVEGDRMSRDYSAPFRIAGSRGSSISLPDTQETHDSIRPVANLLLEAAHADGDFCEAERATVRALLCQLSATTRSPRRSSGSSRSSTRRAST